MAVVDEVAAVIKLMVDLSKRIQRLKDDWERAPKKLENLRDNLDVYRDIYAEELGRTGTDGLPKALLKALEKAGTALSKLEVKRKEGGFQAIFFSFDEMISDLEKDIDKIPKIVEQARIFRSNLRALHERQPAQSIVWNIGDLYVPIEKTQSAIIAALEAVNGPPIILLHGGVGKGKSTLAKYVCTLYSEQTKEKKTFDHTMMVQCDGEPCDRTKTQREILQLLAPRDEKNVEDARIESAFHNFLSRNKTLVILDHVSDPGFLYHMVKAAKGCQCKYLVTSQKSNLCDSFETTAFKKIQMGEATRDEARGILATLVGLKDKKIPPHLQGLADSMIGKVGRNPLALGCLAANFGSSRSKEGWQRVWNDDDKESQRKLLQCPEKKFVLGPNQNTGARSLWGAMKLCFKSLESREAENILFFIYASKGASLPEEVLRILYEQTSISPTLFGRAREELSMRELLKYSQTQGLELYASVDSKPEDQKQLVRYKAWSLPPLVKLYMKQRVADKKKEVESMINSLVEGCKVEGARDATKSEKARVAVVLCALYFDRAHSDESQVVNKAVARVCSESQTEGASKHIEERRKAVEPIIWLLDQPKNDKEWTESDLHHARKSFLRYTCKNQLDNDGISALLKLTTKNPRAQLAVLKALLSIFETETVPPLSWKNSDILEALKEFLYSKEKSRIKDTACKVLERIVKSQVTFLSQDKKPDMQLMAGWALKTLASARSQWLKGKIVNQNRALPDLVHLLKHDKVSTNGRKQAADAFRNLADTEKMSIKETIVNERGALAGLVTALFVDGDSRLQGAAASALRTIASGEGNSVSLDAIVREKRAVSGLVRCLRKEDDTGLQIEAAGALRTLAFGRDGIKKKIVETPNVITGLVEALSERNKTSLREQAAGALKRLAGTADESVRQLIKNHEGLLDGLRKASESKKGNTDLVKQAEGALKNLGSGHRGRR